jgi:hypothetical protein
VAELRVEAAAVSFLKIPEGVRFYDIKLVMQRAWRSGRDVRMAIREYFPELTTKQVDVMMQYGHDERWFK